MTAEKEDPIRTVIVDDEPLAREQLRQLLQHSDDLDIVAECGNGEHVVEVLCTTRPDLVFLDVQMPDASGFDVLAEIGNEYLPVVIFVTAFEEHALKAFEARALDYVLMPLVLSCRACR